MGSSLKRSARVTLATPTVTGPDVSAAGECDFRNKITPIKTMSAKPAMTKMTDLCWPGVSGLESMVGLEEDMFPNGSKSTGCAGLKCSVSILDLQFSIDHAG